MLKIAIFNKLVPQASITGSTPPQLTLQRLPSQASAPCSIPPQLTLQRLPPQAFAPCSIPPQTPGLKDPPPLDQHWLAWWMLLNTCTWHKSLNHFEYTQYCTLHYIYWFKIKNFENYFYNIFKFKGACFLSSNFTIQKNIFEVTHFTILWLCTHISNKIISCKDTNHKQLRVCKW